MGVGLGAYRTPVAACQGLTESASTPPSQVVRDLSVQMLALVLDDASYQTPRPALETAKPAVAKTP